MSNNASCAQTRRSVSTLTAHDLKCARKVVTKNGSHDGIFNASRGKKFFIFPANLEPLPLNLCEQRASTYDLNFAKRIVPQIHRKMDYTEENSLVPPPNAVVWGCMPMGPDLLHR